MLWTGGLEILREMLHLRLGRPRTRVGKRRKKFQNSRLFTVTKVGFHSNKAFPLSHDQPCNSTPLTFWSADGSLIYVFTLFLYFCICLFHQPLHFLCTEDLSIRQAPHYPQACNLPQCLRRGGGGGSGGGLVGGHLYGTPIARPPCDKSTP